ncbi:hypothetical protein [Leisingera sp. ANG-M6]|uniref:hypothetical protein n=1 Tax=Leisingera sp. ANG-M6 TaxID=1577900 RepID=UPI00126988DE|nr:hypothetical protein [Leisingera sp. ANG-M6]
MALSISASAALACQPGLNQQAFSEMKGICGVTHFAEEFGSEGLSEAVDLGAGFVSQLYHSGSACAVAHSQIVSNCAEAKAVVFGPGSYAGAMTKEELENRQEEPFQVLSLQVEASAGAGNPMDLAEIEAIAKNAEMINADTVTIIGRRIGISNSERRPAHTYDLTCGCKHYYPDSAGAKL